MPKIPKSPYKLNKLLKKLKGFGVIALKNSRGKGSEIILLKPDEEGSQKGPTYPIKNHGKGTEITVAVISAALRRFNISPDDFWK